VSVQAEPDLCTSCGAVLPDGPHRMHLDGMEPEGPLVLLCAECAADIDPDDEGDTVADDLDDLDEAGGVIPADAPPGQDYGAEQAGKILGVSGRRVRQLAQEGRLEVVQDRPLRVTAQSVHEMRALRRGTSRPTQATPAPEGVAEQVERLLALFTAENRRAIEATESTLREVTAQRDDYRAEAERLRAQVEAERLRADSLAERLSAPLVPEVAQAPTRSWWKFGGSK